MTYVDPYNWPGKPTCPCGPPSCGAVGLKLAHASGHLARLCRCASCLGRRNRNRGQRGEARRHKRLGGEGWTPRDDLMHLYSVNIATEDKVGAQIPRKFAAFVESETARHWFHQATKKIPVGADALPALYLELSPSKAYLVVDVSGKKLR